MTDEEWGLGWVRCLGMLLNGETIGEVDQSGEPIKDDTFLDYAQLPSRADPIFRP